MHSVIAAGFVIYVFIIVDLCMSSMLKPFHQHLYFSIMTCNHEKIDLIA